MLSAQLFISSGYILTKASANFIRLGVIDDIKGISFNSDIFGINI